MAQEMSSILNEDVETNKIFNNESNSSTNTQKNVLVDPQLQSQSQKLLQSQPEIPEAEGSSSSGSSSSNEINGCENLEDLLGKNWKQDAAVLVEQTGFLKVALMLSSLCKLKSENDTMKHELRTIERRRDHLLAVNSRPANPNTPQSSSNQAPAPPVINNQNGGPIQPSSSNFQPNRHPAHPLSNDIASQVVIRGGDESRSDNRRQVNQNQKALNSNPMYRAPTQQSSNKALPRHQMDAQTKEN